MDRRELKKISVYSEIRTKYNTLSPVQKEIADIVLSSGEDIVLMTISDLAEKCNTSETTIMRFLRKLGINSYQVFKVKIAQELSSSPSKIIYEDVEPDDSIEEIKNKVIYSTNTSIQDLTNILPDDAVECVINLICNANRILFFGVGASGAIACDAFHKFLRIGMNVSFCNDPHIMSILSSQTSDKDLIFAISHSGESREILDAVDIAKENKAKIASITSYPNSTLAKISDGVLLSSTNERKYRSDAMVSRIVQLVIIDILYVILVLKQGPKAIKNVNKSRLAVAKKKK